MNSETAVCQCWRLENVWVVRLLSVCVGGWKTSEYCDCCLEVLEARKRLNSVTAVSQIWILETDWTKENNCNCKWNFRASDILLLHIFSVLSVSNFHWNEILKLTNSRSYIIIFITIDFPSGCKLNSQKPLCLVRKSREFLNTDSLEDPRVLSMWILK
jgi:hypothetical protein